MSQNDIITFINSDQNYNNIPDCIKNIVIDDSNERDTECNLADKMLFTFNWKCEDLEFGRSDIKLTPLTWIILFVAIRMSCGLGVFTYFIAKCVCCISYVHYMLLKHCCKIDSCELDFFLMRVFARKF